MNKSDSLLRRCRRMIRLASDTFVDWRLNVDTLSGAWTAIPRPGDRRYEEWQAAQARLYLPSEASRYGDSKPNIPASWLALRTFVAGSAFGPTTSSTTSAAGAGGCCATSPYRVSPSVSESSSLRVFGEGAGQCEIAASPRVPYRGACWGRCRDGLHRWDSVLPGESVRA